MRFGLCVDGSAHVQLILAHDPQKVQRLLIELSKLGLPMSALLWPMQTRILRGL